MYIQFGTSADFVEACVEMPREHDEHLVILLSRRHASELDDIVEGLIRAGLPFIGAVFPAVINDAMIAEHGAIVQAHPLIGAPMMVNIETAPLDELENLPSLSTAELKPTCLVFADFSCVHVATLLSGLFNKLGNWVSYFGAGVGDGEREPKPVVFSNDGIAKGSAIIAFLGRSSCVGLKHGWARLGSPIIATRTDGNVIRELDWEPAMGVYRKVVGDTVADSLWNHEGVPAAKMFPIGISREGMEDVVRDPVAGLSVEGAELTVLSSVPQNSVVHVLQGNANDLMQAAGTLGDELAETGGAGSCLVFDCFSRAILLEDDISTELQNLRATINKGHAGRPIEGAFALVEIASDGNRIPDFHNKTIAAAVFDDA